MYSQTKCYLLVPSRFKLHIISLHGDYGLYRKAWSYASIGELKSIFKAVTLTIAVVMAVQFAITQDIYLRALALTWMLHILLIGGSRLSWRLMRDTVIHHNRTETKRTMIVGAGQAGTMIARQVYKTPNQA